METSTASDGTKQGETFAISERVKQYSARKPFIAFEYYPPRSESGVQSLKARLEKMKRLHPLYVDFTWGAGGNTSELTTELCIHAQEECGYVANMHLTCTNMPREKVDTALKICKTKNIKNILALRGDPPVGQEDWKPVDSGFSCAKDLITYIKQFEKENKIENFFSLTVAAYPEGHPNNIKPLTVLAEGEVFDADKFNLSDSEKLRVVQVKNEVMVCRDEDYAEEMKYLKAKVDAGASMIVTQMFYDADTFLNFLEECKKYEINVPIIPGIMCVTNYGAFQRMCALCKTRVPPSVSETFAEAHDNPELMKELGIKLGIKMCKKLLEGGVQGLHFYTLNLDEVVFGILKGLDLTKYSYQDYEKMELTGF